MKYSQRYKTNKQLQTPKIHRKEFFAAINEVLIGFFILGFIYYVLIPILGGQ